MFKRRCQVFAAVLAGAVCAYGQTLPGTYHDRVEMPEKAPVTAGQVQVPAVVAKRPLAKFEPEGRKIYHGVCINAEVAADFEPALEKYVKLVGHRPSMCIQFSHAYDKTKMTDWDYHGNTMRTIDKAGAIPFMKATTVSWDNSNIPKTGFQFGAKDILAGKHDDFFVKAARVCRDFGKPMFISWNHEMNGDWYPYSELCAKKSPEFNSDWTAENYKEFQRYVWRIFKREGANNVAFAFAPVVVGRKFGEYDELNSWKAFYPGDEYVDWIAPSYYNEVPPKAWDVLANETNKPLISSEWGTSEHRIQWHKPKPYPGHEAWMKESMANFMNRYPNFKGTCYYQWSHRYAIEREPGQLKAYVDALNSPMFIHGPIRWPIQGVGPSTDSVKEDEKSKAK